MDAMEEQRRTAELAHAVTVARGRLERYRRRMFWLGVSTAGSISLGLSGIFLWIALAEVGEPAGFAAMLMVLAGVAGVAWSVSDLTSQPGEVAYDEDGHEVYEHPAELLALAELEYQQFVAFGELQEYDPRG